MWVMSAGDRLSKPTKRFQKKHRTELRNVFDNLDTFFKCLVAGSKPAQIQRGFVHPEPGGVLAIDQRGEGKHLKQLRLYVYPDEDTKTLHLITLGDKASQNTDIRQCKDFVAGLRAEKEARASHRATDGEGEGERDD